MKRRKLFKLCTVLPLAGCSLFDSGSVQYTIVSPSTLNPGEIVPKPLGEVILTISGKIGQKNHGDVLDFDMPTLERLGLVRYEVDDPELRRTVLYTGVLLKSVLDTIQVDPAAREIRASALNDYKVTIPIDVIRWPVIIATLRDGVRMPDTDKGPLEVVFPNKFERIEPLLYDPMWIWQLRNMVIQ